MDEQEQAIAVRRRRSRAEVEQLAAEYEASGLSRTEFCRKHGVSLGTLNRYLKRRRQQTQGEAAGVNLLAVELCRARPAVGKPEDSGLAVALAGGWRIEVARGFDAGTLVQLLGVLERF